MARRAAERPKRRAAEIRAAAAEVFAVRGYHGATTQDIADVLGIRQASLYYYFPSKEAALEAVCLDGVEAYVASAAAIERGPGTASAKLASASPALSAAIRALSTRLIWPAPMPSVR